jgi:hypothetical protein
MHSAITLNGTEHGIGSPTVAPRLRIAAINALSTVADGEAVAVL